jgi:hypothetical protein
MSASNTISRAGLYIKLFRNSDNKIKAGKGMKPAGSYFY